MTTDRLRTVSLRRRVVLYSLAVLGLVLLAVSVLAEVFVGIGSRSELNVRLADRAALAEQLAARGTAPDDLVDQLAGPSVRVRLVTPTGALYGSRLLTGDPDRPAPNDAGARGPAGPGTPPRAGRRAGPGGPAFGPV
ncbi:MAG: hypothetical protein M3Z25_21435, partial [Actinomycetota bacterium]|nr:hypothetical protein [Actinomycetota bacterium]